MKIIKCELCEGRNVLKQNGIYICQDCGAQYSIDEAKKLMVEVPDGEIVSRAVPVTEQEDPIAKFKQLARRAREANNVENAAKYYEMVVIQDPNDWEGAFYSVYYQSAGTNIAGIVTAASNVENCLPSVMNLIKSRVPKEEQKKALTQIATSVESLSMMMCSTARNHYNQFSTVNGAAYDLNSRVSASYEMVLKAADLISEFDDKNTATPLLNYLYSKNDLTPGQRTRVNSVIERINPSQAETNRTTERENAKAMMRSRGWLILIIGILGFIFSRVLINSYMHGTGENELALILGATLLVTTPIAAIIGLVLIIKGNK